MKIVIAPDSFKNCLPSQKVCQAIGEGLRAAIPTAQIESVPMADGGEGTVDALVAATGGRRVPIQVTGPLGTPVDAFYGILGDGVTAVVEMASAAGLHLVPPEKRDPTKTTTYGVGELIRSALQQGCRRIIVGVGGSATNDGGAGMAQALGVRLLDTSGNDLPFGGACLLRLASIDLSGRDPLVSQATFIVACDVVNPLTGPTGASVVYGPQKGATPDQVRLLDRALRHYARVIREQTGKEVETVPGAGAAGGLAAGLLAFCDARLQKGVELVMDVVELGRRIQECDLVITGEGKLDEQTVFGKVPFGVAQVAKKFGKPVIAIAGQVTVPAQTTSEWGFTACFSILRRIVSEEEAIRESYFLLKETAQQVGSLWSRAQGLAPNTAGRDNRT